MVLVHYIAVGDIVQYCCLLQYYNYVYVNKPKFISEREAIATYNIFVTRLGGGYGYIKYYFGMSCKYSCETYSLSLLFYLSSLPPSEMDPLVESPATSSTHIHSPCFSVYELRNKLFCESNAVYAYTYKNQIKTLKPPLHWVMKCAHTISCTCI